jgi:RND family efflux transporter MFP subunit
MKSRNDRVGAIRLLGVVAFLLTVFPMSMPAGAETIEWDGLIEPCQTAKIGSPVPGILDVIHVERGQIVRKGQVIASLQCSVEKASVELARARVDMDASIKARKEALEFETRNQQRLKELHERKAIPFNEWDQVETKRILAEHQLAEALENKRIAEMDYKRAVEVLTRMSIRSPLNGVVVERFLSPGEYIENESILRVAQIDPLYVEVFLPVSTLGLVKVGMTGIVKPQEPCGGEYAAKVIVVDKVIDAASGTFGVRLELPNPEHKIMAGLKCKVVFQKSR